MINNFIKMKSKRITCEDIGEMCDNCANGELYPCSDWQMAKYIIENLNRFNYLNKLNEEVKKLFLSLPTNAYNRSNLPLYKIVIEKHFPECFELFNKLLLLM
jgi:hypothetical protein